MPTATLQEIDSKIRDFMTSSRRLLIDGKWVDAQSGETFPVYNPASGEVLHQCAAGDKADIDVAVKAARRAFEQGPWPRLTHGQRGKLIWKLADLIEDHLEEFAQLESLDNGKPLAVARVRAYRWPSICSGTCLAGRPKLKDKPFRPVSSALTILPTRSGNQLVSLGKSFPGIFRC